QGSGLGIARLEKPGVMQMVAADADENVVPDNDWRRGGRIVQLWIHDLDFPALPACLSIQADQMTVRRFKEQPVAIHADAAIPNRTAGVSRVLIVPQLAPRAHVRGPDVVRNREVQNAVYEQ